VLVGKKGNKMDVILLHDVPNVGKVGEVKAVADGYARNYLLPRGLAKPATSGEVKQMEQYKRMAIKRAALETENARALAEHLSQMKVTFQARAGEGTKLYGSITSHDIAEKLSEALGKEFDRRKIQLESPLRQLGSHQVPIRLQADIVPEVTVVIEREDEPSEE
jgi:large subunit ribosomal protein L9